MHLRRRETLGARERFGTRSDCFSNKCSALFVKSSLVLDRLQHKRVG
jgi:hypothetical protein